MKCYGKIVFKTRSETLEYIAENILYSRGRIYPKAQMKSLARLALFVYVNRKLDGTNSDNENSDGRDGYL